MTIMDIGKVEPVDIFCENNNCNVSLEERETDETVLWYYSECCFSYCVQLYVIRSVLFIVLSKKLILPI